MHNDPSSFPTLFAFAGDEPKSKEYFQRLIERVGWSELLQVVGIIVAAIVISYAFRRLVLTRCQRMAARTDSDVDDRLVRFVSRMYKALIGFIALIVVLRVLRVELTPLLAGAGIVGIAIAYASKDIIGNFLSGIFLVIDRPIKVGDRILIERIGTDWGSWGDVLDVGLRSTTVKNTDGVHVTYPNGKLAESIIRNFTPNDDPLRFRTRVLVDYNADLDEALRVLVEVAQQQAGVLEEPKPKAVLRSVFNSAGNVVYDGALLELRCFVTDIRVRTGLRSKLLLNIKRAFDERGIRVAQPRVAVSGHQPDAEAAGGAAELP